MARLQRNWSVRCPCLRGYRGEAHQSLLTLTSAVGVMALAHGIGSAKGAADRHLNRSGHSSSW
jgi:hypothetical protein